MKSKTTLLATLLIAAVIGLIAPRQAQARVDFSYFYDSLQPYGDWVDVDQYGYCWMPRGVAPDWRPYTDGYWTYTDAGWTWVSYEDFGPITYHYGRWVRLEDVGWVWRPDYRWGPAWVSWRQSDRYVGWAPLPPEAEFNEKSGIGVWVDRDYDIGPSAYVFCEPRYFGAPVLQNVIVPPYRNVDILDMTVNVTNVTVLAGHEHGVLVFNGGPDYRWLAERSERPIGRLELMLQSDGDWLRHRHAELSRQVGSQLFIDAPEIDQPHERFVPARVARTIRAPRIDKGWAGITDPGVRERIHQRYQEQTRGLTRQTAPAYSVNSSEVRSFVRDPKAAPSAITRGQPPVQTLKSVSTQQRPQSSGEPAQSSHRTQATSTPAEQAQPTQRTRPPVSAAQQPRERETPRPQAEQPQRPTFENSRSQRSQSQAAPEREYSRQAPSSQGQGQQSPTPRDKKHDRPDQ